MLQFSFHCCLPYAAREEYFISTMVFQAAPFPTIFPKMQFLVCWNEQCHIIFFHLGGK